MTVNTASATATGTGARPILCREVADLYAPAAREAIAAHLEAWLARQSATVFELLHRPDLAAKLENSGAELQQALQKVAVPAALAGAGSVHEVMRILHRVFDQAVGRLQRLRRDAAPQALSAEDLAARAADLAEAPDGAFHFGCALAARLAKAEGWSAKVDLLLDLAEAAPVDELARRFALDMLEQPLREILRTPAAQAELFPEAADVGQLLVAQLAVSESLVFAAVSRAQPALTAAAPAAAPAAVRLGRVLATGLFPAARRSLNRRVLAQFSAARRLRPADAAGEIELIRLLAVTLTASAGPLLPEDDVRAAVVARSKLLVEPDFLTALIGPAPEPLAELSALVTVLENVAGEANRRRAVRLLEGSLATRRVHRLLAEAPRPDVHVEALLRLRHRIVRATAGGAGAEGVLAAMDALDGLSV